MIANGVFNVGVNDREIDLFEGQYVVEKGMAYNSYLLIGEKTAVMDSVGGDFFGEWTENIENRLAEAGRKGQAPDFLVVLHMEPDHSANIFNFIEKYPSAKIVSSAKSFVMMKNFFGKDLSERAITVKENDVLDIGGKTLKFISAPMVHWPEVLTAYDGEDKIFFSADAFGKFGTTDADEDWACEARRYYFGIVGKYGAQVQTLLKKAAALDIKTICSLHGPVLNDNLGYYLNLYNIWSSYGVESKGVMIAYTSVYGHTKAAATLLAEELKNVGCEKVVLTDLAREDMAEAVEDAFRYGKLVLASTTYNAGVFPFMRTFLTTLAEHNFQNRKIGFIENGSWAPFAAKAMKEIIAPCKNLTFAATEVKILSSMTEENRQAIKTLAKEMTED